MDQTADCIACDTRRRRQAFEAGDWSNALRSRMIVCPECGNKRCPKASDHVLKCSGSNETGQPGSFY